MDETLTIVVPMAGLGSRFAAIGVRDPKPLIPINGVPMIGVVIGNIRPVRPHRFIFVCQRAHVREYRLKETLAAFAPNPIIVELDGLTEGAACTVLAAREHFGEGPLMIANSDQYIDFSIDAYLAKQDQGLDGLIMTMRAEDPKWSFVRLRADGAVAEVVEKEVVSNEATVGIYNFARAGDFVSAAEEMIHAGKRVNGEFYVAPVYNALIARGANIGVCNIGSVGRGMHGLGTPADLAAFLAHPISRRLGEAAA